MQTRMMRESSRRRRAWGRHCADERDAAHLYRALAVAEPDAERRRIFLELARVEERHAERWRELLTSHGMPMPSERVSRRARLLTWLSALPMAEGLLTGAATAMGAMVPILPFLLLRPRVATWVALAASMLAHDAVGAARSLFTGRGAWRSGRDMFLVGFGVAAAGYAIGELLRVLL